MPLNHTKAREQWLRYTYARDTGHTNFVHKAERCERFVVGDQWEEEDKSELRASRRPFVTINKVLITLASVTGEQIETRNEISFRPRSGATTEASQLHTKLFKFISDMNQLDWVRTAVFADGAVTSRGYYDVRLDFDKNLAGDVAITKLNPRNVLPDPDAADYDPDTWNDVIVTTWMTPDDIEMLYNKPDADALRHRVDSAWSFGYDSIDVASDRFGGHVSTEAEITDEMRSMLRSIRVIERQHRVRRRQRIFVDKTTGMKRDIPDDWTRDDIAEAIRMNPKLLATDEIAKRIRWTVTAEDFVLMDEWSPYKHFTVVPYFPVLRYGRTVGLVEGLIDPQELLNKTISQELHVVNTMANSGWMVRTNSILNMTMDELEEMGAKTGLVLEIQGEPGKDVVKIQPNAIPTGLDRISFKAENFIKSISGRGDSVMGLDRADVSGKAIGEKKESADVPLRPALDNLVRTDWMLARNIIDIVQQYYTDPRILNITKDDLTGEMEAVEINMPEPGSGEILNDLSLGEFSIVVVSQAAKRTLEESQFEQGVAMRELGIQIPDRFLIENSNLIKKAEIVKAMEAEANSEASQIREKADLLGRQLEVANLKADASETEAKSVLAKAKATKELQEVQNAAGGQDAEMLLEKQKHDQEMQMMREKHELDMQIQREKSRVEIQEKQMMMVENVRLKRAQALMAQKQAAKPGGGQPAKPAAQAAA